MWKMKVSGNLGCRGLHQQARKKQQQRPILREKQKPRGIVEPSAYGTKKRVGPVGEGKRTSAGIVEATDAKHDGKIAPCAYMRLGG
jgi:hypothetical protein